MCLFTACLSSAAFLFIHPTHNPQIWSLSNIFSAPGSPQRPPTERNNLAPPDRVVPPPLPSGPSAWLYFNLLITQSQMGGVDLAGGPELLHRPAFTQTSRCAALAPDPPALPLCTLAFPPLQIFVPIYEVAAAQELCTELWGSAGRPRSEFERLADMALAVAAFKEADETGGGWAKDCRCRRAVAQARRRWTFANCRTALHCLHITPGLGWLCPQLLNNRPMFVCRRAAGPGAAWPGAVRHRAALCLRLWWRRRGALFRGSGTMHCLQQGACAAPTTCFCSACMVQLELASRCSGLQLIPHRPAVNCTVQLPCRPARYRRICARPLRARQLCGAALLLQGRRGHEGEGPVGMWAGMLMGMEYEQLG